MEPQTLGHAPKVLVIPASYFADQRTVGGGERYALEYARALARLTPTTLGLFGPEPATEKDGALTVETFACGPRQEWYRFPLPQALRDRLHSFDIWHLMVFPTPLGDRLAWLAGPGSPRLVLTDVGGGGRCWSTYLSRIHPALNLNRRAHGLALLTDHAASFFEDWRQPRVILYGGADIRRWHPAPGPHTAGSYALYTGRLLPHKGVLEIIRSLPARLPLHVVGRVYDTAYFEQLRTEARGRDVSFVTDADDARLLAEYQGARFVLQPSLPPADGAPNKTELLGLVTLEAMACGKPVIVTRTASLPELVEDQVTGLVVPPGDGNALARAMATLGDNQDLAVRMGRAARSRVENHFVWERVVQRGLAFYRELLKSR